MNRNELLARAAEENIPLTESKLRRYINLGLIISQVRGRGRARGTSAYYNERTIDTLKEIQRLSHIKQEALILTLYWKGYPVAWEKLKGALRGFVSTIDSTFIDAFKVVSDPDNADFAIREIAKDALPPKKPGRPTKEDEAELEHIYNQEMKHAKGMLNFVIDLGTQRMLTVANMLSFFEINEITVPADPSALFSETINWTSLDLIFTSVLKSEEQDFIEMTEVISTLKWYWNELERTLIDPITIPYFSQLFELIDKHCPGGFVAENTALIKYLLLVLLLLNQQLPIKDFLQSEVIKTVFILICQQLSTLELDVTERR